MASLISNEQLKSIVRSSFKTEDNITYESTTLEATNKAADKFNSSLSSDSRTIYSEEAALDASLTSQSKFNYYPGKKSSDTTLVENDTDLNVKKPTTFNNKEIQVAYETQADAMSNMFDVFFVNFNNMTNDSSKDWTIVDNNPFMRLMLAKAGTDNTSLPYVNEDTKKYIKNLYNPQVIGVRILSIDIPQLKSNTSDIPFLTRNVTKQNGSVASSHDGSFSIRLDQDLYLADLFQMLSGKKVWKTEGEKQHDRGETWGRSQRQIGIEETGTGSDKTSDTDNTNKDAKTSSYHTDNPGMCIIVRVESLAPSLDSLYSRGIISKDSFVPIIDNKKMPYFVFEHVKFLGSSDSITFGESAQPSSMNVKFVFRRMYKVLNSYVPSSLNDFSEISGNILQVNPSSSEDVSLSDVLKTISDNDNKFYEGI